MKKVHKNKDYSPYFEEPLYQGMLERMSVWYEAGMAETYLYTCLVEAIEDEKREGLVLYDPRADWKLKTDAVVILHGRITRISAFTGSKEDRPQVEARRSETEKERKKNTMRSAHWGNKQLDQIPQKQITLTEEDCQIVNGVKLFSLSAVKNLLDELYRDAGIQEDRYIK